ncbi:MAG: butyrate kinase [Lachnospiraceae bacterium]|nr:butyrate kinase [Lachnospiraceae bacterium]
MTKKHLILAINPGSTSTKAAVYEDHVELTSITLRYDEAEIEKYDSILDQKEFRANDILEFLSSHSIDCSKLDAVVGRGGLLRPIESGAYLVNENMLSDLEKPSALRHASALGGLIAHEIAKKYDIPAFICDATVTDELLDFVRISGLPEIERTSQFHCLNAKAMAKKCAAEQGISYTQGNYIVAHMGGGTTVSAHRKGRIVDTTNGVTGEGPFSPNRPGSLPAEDLIRMCFSGKYTEKEMLAKIHSNGGIKAYLGTTDMIEVTANAQNGDEKAALIINALTYQVASDICAKAAVLNCEVDGIILTGGLAYSELITSKIKERITRLGKVYVYPGEDELGALTAGVLPILKGTEKYKVY